VSGAYPRALQGRAACLAQRTQRVVFAHVRAPVAAPGSAGGCRRRCWGSCWRCSLERSRHCCAAAASDARGALPPHPRGAPSARCAVLAEHEAHSRQLLGARPPAVRQRSQRLSALLRIGRRGRARGGGHGRSGERGDVSKGSLAHPCWHISAMRLRLRLPLCINFHRRGHWLSLLSAGRSLTPRGAQRQQHVNRIHPRLGARLLWRIRGGGAAQGCLVARDVWRSSEASEARDAFRVCRGAGWAHPAAARDAHAGAEAEAGASARQLPAPSPPTAQPASPPSQRAW